MTLASDVGCPVCSPCPYKILLGRGGNPPFPRKRESRVQTTRHGCFRSRASFYLTRHAALSPFPTKPKRRFIRINS